MLTSRINYAIPLQRFELIRDRLAEILLVEFSNQQQLQTDSQLKDLLSEINIFPERFHALNESEIFAIAIFYFDGSYDNKSQTSARGNYTFYIDIIGRAASTNQDNGDKRAAEKCQRLGGLIRTILESPQWIRLGFDESPKFIERTLVRSLKRTEEENTRDTSNIILYRMIMEVVANETTVADEGVELALSTTNVTVEETELGYQYIYDPNA